MTVTISQSHVELNKSDLEKLRRELNDKIGSLNAELQSLDNNKTDLISKYNLLETQVESRKKLIKTIQKELTLINSDIEIKSIARDTFSEDLDQMIEDYGQLLKVDYIERLKRNDNLLLLKSKNLEEAVAKWKYLKQFENFLANKLSGITETTKIIAKQDQDILNARSQKEALLETEKENLRLMELDIKALEQNLKSDLTQRQEIQTELKHYNSSRENLNKKIESILFKSFSSDIYSVPTSEKEFEQRKGFMPWPVNKKSIALRYGEQFHPTHQNIKINNSGIDIRSSDQLVSSITHGIVSNVVNISDDETTIIIKHDNNYYTVYSNLNLSFVKKNDYISSGQAIGELSKKEGKEYEIHFEVWKGKENLNPTNWLKNN